MEGCSPAGWFCPHYHLAAGEIALRGRVGWPCSPSSTAAATPTSLLWPKLFSRMALPESGWSRTTAWATATGRSRPVGIEQKSTRKVQQFIQVHDFGLSL